MARQQLDLVCPTADPLPEIPDDLTVVQFVLDSSHPTRPARNSDVPWLIEDHSGRKIGFEELRLRTFGFANSLALKYNIREDDVVVIFSPNHVDYPVVIWGVHRLGAIVSCANPAFNSEELTYQLVTTKATLIIAHPASFEIALSAAQAAGIPSGRIVLFDVALTSGVATTHELVNEGLKSDPAFEERRLRKGESRTKVAFLSFSSGTTGKPKAVAIPHIALITNLIQMAIHNKINRNGVKTLWSPGDVAIGVLPFFHIYGLVVNLHYVLFCAMSVVVVPKFNFLSMLDSIHRHKITHLLLVPPHAVLLCKHEAVKNYDLSHVKLTILGAAPAPNVVVNKLKLIFPKSLIGQGYGMTETATTVSMVPPSQTREDEINSCGQILPGIICRVVKDDGSFGGYGDKGELYVKTPSSALSYADNEQATKETFVNGWVRTGDSVVIDEQGEVFVVDRVKEIMKVKGFQVAPAELEGCLLGHPDVSDACVVGVPDEYSGEIPLAFVVLNANALKRLKGAPELAREIKLGIIKFVAAKKIHYKQLAGGVEFIDSIPKNPSGKLLRRLLREKAREFRSNKKAKL